MALASVSPTVAGSKSKKLLDQTRDVLRRSARPAKDFESCETVSIAESAQCPLVRCPAQLLSRDQTSLYPKIDIFFPIHSAQVVAGATTPDHDRNLPGR